MDTPDPTLVGNNFVVRYYSVLSVSPDTLHNFYSERSVRTFGNQDDQLAPIKGLQAIKQHIENNKYDECQFDLVAVDCQGSVNGSIFLSVVGNILSKVNAPRKFTQSFFLEHLDNSYFVLNDIFRYLSYDDEQGNGLEEEEEEEEVAEEPEEVPVQKERAPEKVEPVPAPTPAPAPAPVAAPAPTPAPAAAPVAAAKTEQAAPAKTEQAPAKSEQPPKAEQPTHAAQANANKPDARAQQPAAEKKAEAAKPSREAPKSNSWASVVGRNEPQEHAQPEKPAKAPQQTQHKEQQQHAQQQQSAQNLHQHAQQSAQHPPFHKERSESKYKSGPVLAEGCSLFVNTLPFDTTNEQLQTVFSQFGKVRNIVLKAAKGFAFVEYESPERAAEALKALQSKPVTLPGHSQPLIIEERKPRRGDAPVTLPHSSHSPHASHSPHSAHRGRGGARGGAYLGRPSPRAPRNAEDPAKSPAAGGAPASQQPSSSPSASPLNSHPSQPSQKRYAERRPSGGDYTPPQRRAGYTREGSTSSARGGAGAQGSKPSA